MSCREMTETLTTIAERFCFLFECKRLDQWALHHYSLEVMLFAYCLFFLFSLFVVNHMYDHWLRSMQYCRNGETSLFVESY